MTDIDHAIDALERSTRALRAQLQNPRAHRHHKIEAAIAVETDARWLARLLRSESREGANP